MEELREYLEDRLRENHFIQYMGLKLTHLEHIIGGIKQ